MKMTLVPLVVVLVLVLVGSSATFVSADGSAATYHQLALIKVPGAPLTSFDISFVERSSQTYYLADRSNKAVDIFDASSNTFETRVAGFVGFTGNNDTSGPNGIVVVHDRGEIWAGDGNSTVKVIDLRTDSLVKTVSTAGTARADEVAHDHTDQWRLSAHAAHTPPVAALIATH